MRTSLLPVLPALRWSGEAGYGLGAPEVGRWLDDGAVGFILFGGPAEAAWEASEWLRGRAGRPLLLGADLERGVGQQFRGATALPPLAALSVDGRRDRLFDAGALTGREALAVGIPWVFAPVADLALEPRNPIVGTRSPGADPRAVARAVTAWIEGCLSVGAIPCVKHFPGHGRTLEDSHRALPVVEADRETLSSTDWVPFRAAVEAGVPSVMTAHVAYPALDATGRPATRSRPILTDLLRGAMGFDGVVVTDALIMDGAGAGGAGAGVEDGAIGGAGATAIVEALQAGVDLLLYPPADLPVRDILESAARAGSLDATEREASLARVEALLSRISPSSAERAPGGAWGSVADRTRSLRWALEALQDPGWDVTPPEAVSLSVVDDDVGGPYPAPPRDAFPAALRQAGVVVREEVVREEGVREEGIRREAGKPPPAGAAPLPLLCVYAEPRAWKGRAGLSREARARIRAWVQAHEGQGGIVAFGGPTLRADLPSGLPTLLAWGGEPLMQTAAALRIAGAPSAGFEPGRGGAAEAR